MENLLFIFGLIIGIILISPLLVYFVLAPRNIFFTFGRENSMIHIMTGDKFSGKVILPSKTLYVDENYNIRSLEKTDIKPKHPHQILFNIFGLGMYWIGIWPFRSVYKRHQQWMEWESTKEGRKIRFRDELTPFLITVPFEYAMLLKEGEDKDQMPLDLYFTAVLVPTKALLPIFGNDDAYGQVQTLCLAIALRFVKRKTFAELGGEGGGLSDKIQDEFTTLITDLNKKVPGRFKVNPVNKRKVSVGLEEALGYKILDAKISSVEIAGAHKDELTKASTAKRVAKDNADAEIERAKGGMESAKLEAEGKKAVFDVQREYYKEISGIPGAMKVEERKSTPNLNTLVEGGKDNENKTNLLIGGK